MDALFTSSNPFKRQPANELVPVEPIPSLSKGKKKNAEPSKQREAIPEPSEAASNRKRKRDVVKQTEEVDSAKEVHVEKRKEKAKDENESVDKEKGAEIENNAERTFDSEEKLRRTIFVGNLPKEMKKKALMKEFSEFGEIKSARLRSVPVGNTMIPRKGAVITGQLSESRNSLNAFVVFKEEENAKAALAHNMKEVGGKHIRVDRASVPCKGKGTKKQQVKYDSTRSIFVGNLPFDIEDEEIYTLFAKFGVELEAIRIVRDQKSNIGKGFAFILFKSKDAVKHVLSQGKIEIRERVLRLSRSSKQDDKLPTRKRKFSPRNESTGGEKSTSYEGARAGKKQRGISKPATAKADQTKAKQKKQKKQRSDKRPAVAARKAAAKGIEIKKKIKKPKDKKKSNR